ncbi:MULTISPECIES: hypothetical protein [Paenibacillus]|uniref:YtkA-like domain-containing protein n=1 Tax=Paenibacillus albilobatus TaxID=2716884 RepID=A0A919XL40_9BACL|nr:MULTISPECIES: hypothetical protein [Paenibacillus]GIO33398.1 hypothetical protein J2TS6_45390 [Paenibacillus albilobatus]
MKIMVVVAILLNLFVFQSVNLGQLPSTNIGMESKKTDMKDFTARVTVPKKLKTGKAFAVKADLQVNTEQTMTMMSRENIFVFLIKDRNGKQINSFGVHDVGKVRTLSGKETISEAYHYKIKEPGVYMISAVAEFKIDKDGSIKGYKIEADPQTVEVTE